jgi:hypothetical protein
VDHPYYIEKYITEFEKLWKSFESNSVVKEENAAKTIQSAYRGKKSYHK